MPIDRQELRDAIQRVYSEVAHDPKKGYHVHTGPEYAAAAPVGRPGRRTR